MNNSSIGYRERFGCLPNAQRHDATFRDTVRKWKWLAIDAFDRHTNRLAKLFVELIR